MDCKVYDAVDLSVDIPWKIEDMDSEDNSATMEKEAKVVEKSLKALSFCKRMKRLLPHCLPLKEQMKDCTIS